MSNVGLLRKDQLELSLHQEKKLIEDGVLKEDNPLDLSEPFRVLCEACRRGDLKTCQETISEGVNINAKDQYDYTPLILASLCGHYETVQLLLEAGALCERDTFQGERCLYNALNDKIRNLLLSYDYSKSTDPLQPLASHLTSLLIREQPHTSDITVTTISQSFNLHKFILSARSPYFRNKLSLAPDTTSWKLPTSIPPQSFSIALKHLYLGELPRELGGGPGTGYTDVDILAGVDRISKHLEIRSLSELILDSTDRRLARQRRTDEVEQGREQLDAWFQDNVLKHRLALPAERVEDVKWDRDNAIFADVLIRADEDEEPDSASETTQSSDTSTPATNALGIPLASRPLSRSSSQHQASKRSVLYPCHKAILIRSEFFLTMFDSLFREAQKTKHLQIVPIDCSPAVMEVILTFLYTERADFGLDMAIDVLFAADMLFLEKLKAKAAVVISTLGNGTASALRTQIARDDEQLDIYEILRAAWVTRVQRLEDFAARYIAYRLEAYIDDPEFADIIRESAGRINARQETDSIELLDDLRYHLSERFRLRFEDTGFDEIEEQALLESQQQQQGQAPSSDAAASDPSKVPVSPAQVPSENETDASSLPPASQQPPKPDPDSIDPPAFHQAAGGVIRTLDGEIAGDEFAADAMNYQSLLAKLDDLLEKLKLDA